MLNPSQVQQRASEILAARRFKPELSPQAIAVIEAITETLNAELLANQETTQKQIDAVKQTASGRMKKPTIEEVISHGATIELSESECRRFFSHYESNGWRVGKNPMKLWTAAMANWKRNTPEINGHQSSGLTAAQMILNQNALARVEDRIKVIRGHFPLTAGDKRITELQELKTEQTRLKTTLGFKA